MSTREDPSRQRRRLRVELRRVRDAAGLTQRQAAERLEWSLSKLIRIEAGTVGVSVTDLRAMLQLYGVTKQSLVDGLTEATSKAVWALTAGRVDSTNRTAGMRRIGCSICHLQ